MDLVPKINFGSSFDYCDNSQKGNKILVDIFVKHRGYKYFLERMLENISEKMKSR